MNAKIVEDISILNCIIIYFNSYKNNTKIILKIKPNYLQMLLKNALDILYSSFAYDSISWIFPYSESKVEVK